MVGFNRHGYASILLADHHVTGEHDTLGHEHLNNVEKQREGIELEDHQVQYVLFLLAKFILLGIESLVGWMHRVIGRQTVHLAHALIVHLLFVVLLLLAWLVAWELPQELP